MKSPEGCLFWMHPCILSTLSGISETDFDKLFCSSQMLSHIYNLMVYNCEETQRKMFLLKAAVLLIRDKTVVPISALFLFCLSPKIHYALRQDLVSILPPEPQEIHQSQSQKFKAVSQTSTVSRCCSPWLRHSTPSPSLFQEKWEQLCFLNFEH